MTAGSLRKLGQNECLQRGYPIYRISCYGLLKPDTKQKDHFVHGKPIACWQLMRPMGLKSLSMRCGRGPSATGRPYRNRYCCEAVQRQEHIFREHIMKAPEQEIDRLNDESKMELAQEIDRLKREMGESKAKESEGESRHDAEQVEDHIVFPAED